MKRFRWRLQRVLSITEQREEALRNDVAALGRRILAVNQEILARREAVRVLLDELGRRPLAQRMGEQTLVLACASVERRVIQALQARQKDLEAQRAAKMEQYVQMRQARQTLERLREEARQRYLAEQNRLEQAQFDESAHVAFARRERPKVIAAAT
jgi:hypothetical protein